MTEPRRKISWPLAVGIAAAGALLVGFLVLLIPVSAAPAGSAATVSCGSGLLPSRDAAARDGAREIVDAITGRAKSGTGTYAAACASALSGRRSLGWPLVVIGGLTALGVGTAFAVASRPTTAGESR